MGVVTKLETEDFKMKSTFVSAIMILLAVSVSPLLADGRVVTLTEGHGDQQPKQPQVFVSAEGHVDVVYALGNDVHLLTSKDKGVTFTAAKSVIPCPNMSAGMRRGPRVVRVGSTVVVTAIGGMKGKGKDGDLLAWHSNDDGATWSEPVMVNSVADAAREGLHAMTAGTNGEVWCAWLDLRTRGTSIRASVSRDGGKSWGKNAIAYESPEKSVCECCHPSIACDIDGTVHILFRNSLSGNRDMYLVSSKDGQKFSSGEQLGNSHWKLDACPMDGGMLATDGKGKLLTVWRRDNGVFAVSDSSTKEAKLGSGQQPWCAWAAHGPIIVWTQDRVGTLFLQRGTQGKATQLADKARDPVVASIPGSDFSIVCWETKKGENVSLMAMAVSE